MEISTAADFEKLAAERRAAAAEPVTLPSGLKVMVYRPQLEWWIRHVGRLPQSMAAKVSGDSGTANVSNADLLEFAMWASKLMSEMIVAPKVTLNPKPGEVDPSWISDDDLKYLLRFAGGEIAADGQGLDSFSGKQGAAVPVGENRTDVELPAERTA